MVSINYSAREVCCKIVYYGPGLSGKTTNLQYVHAKVPNNTRGKLISLATEADRTLYFDFLPINIGTINGFNAKFQLYTVPGQVYYNATRKLVLRGVDGLVFVADSQADKMDDNLESLTNLEENLLEYGYDINQVPVVIQYNKRDLPNVLTVDELNARLNSRGWPSFEASATIGNGVFDTLKMIIKLVLDRAKRTGSSMTAKPTAVVQAQEPPAQPQTAAVSAPYPEPTVEASREMTTAVSQPIPGPDDTGPQQIAAQAPPAAAAYRPYPGSENAAPAPASPSQPAATSQMTGTTTEVQPDDAALKRNIVGDSASEKETTGMPSPQMAPSLRRRGETKKRGFFKRLFGLK
jgi:signal recognition particle receptor subunit beta